MFRLVVFITAFLVTFFDVALLYNFGTIFVHVMETFNATRAETSMIQSTALGVGPCSGIIGSFFINKFGIMKCGIVLATFASASIMSCYFATSIWYITVSFGIIYGTCVTNLFICSTTAISYLFTGRKRILVISLQVTSVGLGGMVYPYVLSFLIAQYGLRGALLITGGLCMNCIPGCLLWTKPMFSRKKKDTMEEANKDRIMQYQSELDVKVTEVKSEVVITKNQTRPRDNDIYYIQSFPVLSNQQNTKVISVREQKTQQSTGEKSSILKHFKTILGNWYFVAYWIGTALASSSLNVILVFIADIFLNKGLSKDDAKFGLLLLNVLNILSRILFGLILQIKRLPILFCSFLGTFMASLAFGGFILAQSRLDVLLVSAFAGLPIGVLRTTFSAVPAHLVGTDSLPVALGLLSSTAGVLNNVLGPINGYVRDAVGSYNIPLFVALGVTGLCSVVFAFVTIQQCKETSRRRRTSSVFYLTSL